MLAVLIGYANDIQQQNLGECRRQEDDIRHENRVHHSPSDFARVDFALYVFEHGFHHYL